MAARRRLALLGLLAAVVLGEEESQESAVVTLTSATFTPTAAKTDHMLVMFHAPWCGHCKSLAPEWETAAKELVGKIVLAKVDVTVETELKEKHSVKIFPTIKFFRRGVPSEYNGGRKAAEIVAWALGNNGPAFVELDAPSAGRLIQDKNFSTSLFVATGGEELLRIFTDASESKRGIGTFVFVRGSPNSLEVHRGHFELQRFDGDFGSLDAVKSWMAREILADFGQVDDANFEEYLLSAPDGILWICFPPSELTTQPATYAAALGSLAKEHRGSIPFVWLDTLEFEEHAKEDLKCDTYPMVVIQLGNMTDEKYEHEVQKYRHALKPGFDVGEVARFFSDVRAGKVEAYDELDELDDDEEEEGPFARDDDEEEDRTDL